MKTPKTKVCTDCDKRKKAEEYPKQKECVGGRTKKCKKCTANALSRIERRCQQCGKTFNARSGYPTQEKKFCSHKCFTDSRRKRIKRKCIQCGKTYESTPAEIERSKVIYCSRKCRSDYHHDIRKCKYCGKTFRIMKSRTKQGGGKYCSTICSQISQTSKIIRLCEICGKEFKVIPYNIKRGKGKYCSYECKIIAKNRGLVLWTKRKKTARKQIKCLTCGKIFEIRITEEGKYCSKECHYKNGQKRITIQCRNCDTEFQSYKKQDAKKIYCSRKCYFDYRRFNKPIITCDCCGKTAPTFQYLIDCGKRFCSRKCYLDWVRIISDGGDEWLNLIIQRQLRVKNCYENRQHLKGLTKTMELNIERSLSRLIKKACPEEKRKGKHKMLPSTKTNLLTLMNEMENYYVNQQANTTKRTKARHKDCSPCEGSRVAQE